MDACNLYCACCKRFDGFSLGLIRFHGNITILGNTMEHERNATLDLGNGNPPLEFPVLAGTTWDLMSWTFAPFTQSGHVFTYDPGFLSTASSSSSITFIDGDKGILLYRGYPIEQLAMQCDFMEVCYLLLNGNCRTSPTESVIRPNHQGTHDGARQLARFYTGFRRDAHPMAVMVGVVGALSAFYHDAMDISDASHRELSAFRLIAKLPTITAMAYRIT